MLRSLLLLLAVWLCASQSLALAEPRPDQDVEARLLYQAGVAAYDAGRYEDALDRFQRAYELSGRDVLLYNIGTAAERARQDELALDAYERFLEAEPETHLRGRVETVIARLRREIEQAKVEGAEEAIDAHEGDAAEEPAPLIELGAQDAMSESKASGPAGIITLAAGGAVLVAGAVTLGMGLADRARVESPAESARDWQRDAARSYERGPALLTTGLIALPVGAALTAVGAILMVKGAGKKSDADPEAAHVEVSFGGSTVFLRGRF